MFIRLVFTTGFKRTEILWAVRLSVPGKNLGKIDGRCWGKTMSKGDTQELKMGSLAHFAYL